MQNIRARFALEFDKWLTRKYEEQNKYGKKKQKMYSWTLSQKIETTKTVIIKF
jgi:hypothetical protein